MTSEIKNVSKTSVKQVGRKEARGSMPPKVDSMRSLGMLDYDSSNRQARKSQQVPSSADMHSQHTAQRSEHYHARIIGQVIPKPDENESSPRPGLTAQRGLGG